MASEMLITGMKLGRRWLYVVWIAATVLWHQAGAASLSPQQATTSQWAIADEDRILLTPEFALQGPDGLEDQDLTKRTNAFTAFIENFAEINAPTLVATGATNGDLPHGISATTSAWQLIRGPPALGLIAS